MVYYTVSNKNYFYKNYKNGNKKRISKEEYYKKVGGNNYNNQAANLEANGLQANRLPVNGLPVNGLPVNGLPVNGLQSNGLQANGLQANGLQSNGLQSNGLQSNGLQAANKRNLNRQINVSKTDIETWLEIENILCRDYSNRKFLLPNNTNKCSKLNNCSLNSNCDLYYSKSKKDYLCVNKKRISKFEGSKNEPLILKGKNNKTYTLLNTIVYENDQNKYYHRYYKIYCHVFEKYINGIKYLILGFNCGIKVDLEIYENPEFIKYLNNLYDIILNEYLNYDKFIICGHSMGANTAIQLVLYFIQNNNEVFNEKCKCIISGMSNILNETQQTLINNNPNILLFMNGLLLNTKKRFIDHFYQIYNNKNNFNHDEPNKYSNYQVYYPFIYIYTYPDLNINSNELLFNYYKVNTKEKFKVSKIHDYLHQWHSYYSNIKEFLKLI
jgi:hypothetical protein